MTLTPPGAEIQSGPSYGPSPTQTTK